MRYAYSIAALLAGTAIASPIDIKKRALVIETAYAVVMETVFVTDVEGAAPATPTPAPAPPTVVTVVESVATPAAQVVPVKIPNKQRPAPVKPSPQPAPTPSSAPASSSYASTYQSAVLLHHNLHRANHSADPLTWSDSLASIAQSWASQCNFEHNTQIGGGGYGQNIAAGSSPQSISNVITDEMYNGEMPYYAGQYGLANPSFASFENWGHFSQIIWASTQQVGCATVQCGSVANTGSDVAPYMTVCNYSPPGNMGGEYGANVGEPLGQPTITGSYETDY